MTTRLFPTFVLMSLLLTACGGSDGPVELPGGPGTVTATLESPNGAEGGVLIHLIGNGASSVTAPVGDLFTSVSGDTVKVLLLRQEPGELAFSFSLPDTTRPPSVRLQQVAGGDNQLRVSLADYTVRLGG
jgi:hypothetical protein